MPTMAENIKAVDFSHDCRTAVVEFISGKKWKYMIPAEHARFYSIPELAHLIRTDFIVGVKV